MEKRIDALEKRIAALEVEAQKRQNVDKDNLVQSISNNLVGILNSGIQLAVADAFSVERSRASASTKPEKPWG